MKNFKFFSKKTNNLLIEFELFQNSFVFWTFDPCKEDQKLFNKIGLTGSDEISLTDGNNAIDILRKSKQLLSA